MTTVPTLRVKHLSEVQKRAYVLADNRLTELAGWDSNLLAEELEAIQVLEPDFDLTVTGWNTPELDTLLDGDQGAQEEDEEEDNAPAVADLPVSRPGDLWILGDHRLLCGDARDPSSFEHLMDGSRAQMVITDPPYNVPTDGHVSGLGETQHREFAMASGEMSEAEFTSFLRTVMRNLVEFTIDGSLHFIFMDWRHVYELLNSARGVYTEQKNLIVWNKSNGGMGSLYRSKHELIFLFKNGKAPHVNNIELGQHGRYRSNVWDYVGANTFRKSRMEDLKAHPTVKSVRLLADAMLDCSDRAAGVLDCFVGSGSIFLAAERTQRKAFGLGIDPAYVDVCVRRWQNKTKRYAIHFTSGLLIEELRSKRTAFGENS